MTKPYKNVTRSSKRTCCCWSGSYKILTQKTFQEPPTIPFIQAPLGHVICNIFMQGPLREDLTRISTRSSVKDLYSIMQGPLREEFSKISTRAVYVRFRMKIPQAKGLRTLRRTLCVSLRNWHALGHVTRAILRENLQEKNAAPQSRRLCPSPRSRSAHGHSKFMREFSARTPQSKWHTLI